MIDYDDMYLLLQQAAETRPGFSIPLYEPGSPWHLDNDYNTIRYTREDGTPGCIMGWVFHELGLQQHLIEGRSIYGIMETVNRAAPTFTEKAMELAEYAQDWQDDNKPWDRALHLAATMVSP